MTPAEQRLKVAIEVLGDHAWVKTWVQHTAVEKLLEALLDAKREIALHDDRISDLERLLNLFECSAHGSCIPHAIDEVKKMREKLAIEDNNVHPFLGLLECGYCHEIEGSHGDALICMPNGEIQQTVYTPRIAFDRIAKLEAELKTATTCGCGRPMKSICNACDL